MKKLFEFKTKTIVATGIGAALFMLLFMYVKVPTGIPETDVQTAYGIGACRIESLCHLCNLSALGSKLYKEGDGYSFFYSLCNFSRHTCLLTHTCTCLLFAGFCTAGCHFHIVAHIGATHIKLNYICTGFFELLCHIYPAGNSFVAGVGNICHKLKVIKKWFCISYKL